MSDIGQIQKAKKRPSAVSVFGCKPEEMSPAERAKAITGYQLRHRIEALVSGVTQKKIKHHYYGDGACTNDDMMVLPSIPQTWLFRESDAKILLGYTAHEISHHLETPFDILEKIFADPTKVTKEEVQLKNWWNAIEDYRIEKLTRRAYPGFPLFINETRRHSGERFNEMCDSGNVPEERLANPYAIGAVALTWVGERLNGYPNQASQLALQKIDPDLRMWVESWQDDLAKVEDPEDSLTLARRILADLQANDNEEEEEPQDGQSGQDENKSIQNNSKSNAQPQDGNSGEDNSKKDKTSSGAGSASNSDTAEDEDNDPSTDEADSNKNNSPESDDASGNDGNDADADGASNESDNSNSSNKDEQDNDNSDGSGSEDSDDSNNDSSDTAEGGNASDKDDGDKDSSESGDADNNDKANDQDGDQDADGDTDSDNNSNNNSASGAGNDDAANEDDPQNSNKEDDGGQSKSTSNSKGDEEAGEAEEENMSDAGYPDAPSNSAGNQRPRPKINDGDEDVKTEISDLSIDELLEELAKHVTTQDRTGETIDENPAATTPTQVEKNQQEYARLRAELGPASARSAGIMRRLLQSQANVRTVRGLEEGALDLTRLVPIVNGSREIYSQQHRTQAVNTAVSVMLDNSGSMSGYPLAVCQKAAIVLDSAITGTGTDLEVNGFTGDTYHPVIYRYRSFGEKGRSAAGTLGGMQSVSLGGTPVSTPMLDAWKRLKEHKAPRKILIVISDGEAADPQRTREVHDLITFQGGVVVGISIGHAAPLLKWCDLVTAINDIDDLPKALTMVVHNLTLARKAA